MLTLKKINKSFSSKVIFDDTQFIANPNELTILIGPSGAGKTTLFSIILNIENCDYTFNNDNISDSDKKEKEQFILDNISYASQKPTFIADLKMNDQIALLKQIYNNDYDVSELITLFELDKLLECYPNQLSGGEKARFAFILALLKPARIYMFDEPTSALDDLQASHIVTVLNDLKKQGNIVIISTHDHRLIEQGDKVYKIENKQLNVIKDIKEPTNNEKINKSNVLNLNKLNEYWIKMKKHHKIYNIGMNLLIALSIVIALSGMEYGYFIKKQFNNMINNDESRLITIYKKPSKQTDDDFSQSTFYFPFDQSDLDKIRSLDNVKNYDNFLSYEIYGNYTIHSDSDNSTSQKDIVVKFADNKKIISFGDINDSSDYGVFSTYSDKININNKISQQWNDEGLYVSNYFYETYLKDIIKNDADKKKVTLTFPLFVPQYLENGSSTYNEVPTNKYVGLYINVEFKIKGIMKSNEIIDNNPSSNNTFALSNKEMQTFLDKYKKNDSQYCMFHSKENTFECSSKDIDYQLQDKNDYIFSYNPLKPKSIVIEVDDVKNIRLVNNKLNELGFDTYSKYISVDNYIAADTSMRNNILFSSFTLFLLIFLMNIILKLNNKENEYSFSLYFKEKGFTNKMIQKLNNQKYFINAIELTCSVAIISIIFNLILIKMFGYPLLGSYKNILIGLILIFLIEYIVPIVLEKYYSRAIR